MPHNNPETNLEDDSGTVYIDASALGELSSQLSQHDLETLVGLNLQVADLEALQGASASSEVLHSDSLLMSDGVIEVDDESNLQSNIDVHVLPEEDESNVLWDEDLSLEELAPEVEVQTVVSQAPQVLRTSTGQYMVVTSGRGPLNLGSFGGRMVTSVASLGTSAKPIVVNASQLSPAGRPHQVIVSQPALSGQQMRTIHLKQPIKQVNTSAGVTKVIIASQAGGSVSPSQLRLISGVQQVTSPTKLTLQQAQQMGLISPTKSMPSSPTKFIVQKFDSSGKSVKGLIPLAAGKSPTKIAPAPSVFQQSQIASTFRTPAQNFSINQSPQLIKIPSSQTLQFLQSGKSYVRLVTSGNSLSKGTIVQTSSTKPIAPAGVNQPIRIKAAPVAQVSKQLVMSNISPATNVRPKGANVNLSYSQPGSVVMIPAHFMSQGDTVNSYVQIGKQAHNHSNSLSYTKAAIRTYIDPNGIRPRKPCNCTKSQCLKLYCECFANGEFCNNCNCNNCFNNLVHEEDRQKAIKACLERNPSAFRPKIGKGGSEAERRHNKGCNCKRSGCLKNYCECYEAKIPCSGICKCVGCRNIDASQINQLDRKGLLQLAELAEARRTHQHNLVKAKLPSISHHSPSRICLPVTNKSSYCRMNNELVEATCHLLLSEANKLEGLDQQEEMESLVISQFSECLMELIHTWSACSRGV